jgi:uncharacterized coiled-coil protein SlyX
LTQENENKQEITQQEVTGHRLAELETRLAAKEAEMAKASARLSELEQALSQSQERLKVAEAGLKKAVSSYRTVVVKANPSVPQDLITGENIEDIELSLKSARELINKVKKNTEAEVAATRVPAGAPPRSSQLASGLTPREKIQQGMEKIKSLS